MCIPQQHTTRRLFLLEIFVSSHLKLICLIHLSDRPKSPVFIKFSARKRSLEWKAVRKSVFVVQLLKNREKCKWINVTTTSKLAVSLHSLNEYFPENTIDTCSVRICLKEKQGSVNASCSHEHRLYSSKCNGYYVLPLLLYQE